MKKSSPGKVRRSENSELFEEWSGRMAHNSWRRRDQASFAGQASQTPHVRSEVSRQRLRLHRPEEPEQVDTPRQAAAQFLQQGSVREERVPAHRGIQHASSQGGRALLGDLELDQKLQRGRGSYVRAREKFSHGKSFFSGHTIQ